MILPQQNAPSGLAIFFQPFTDFATAYRSSATSAGDAARTITIDGVPYVVTKQNQTAVFNLLVSWRERQYGRPLTEAEKNTLAGAVAAAAAAGVDGPTRDANTIGGIATPAADDPRDVVIDGRRFNVTRDNVAELVTLRINQLQRERGAPLSTAERETVAAALARLAGDAGPADANPSTSTLSIALQGIKNVAGVIAGAASSNVNPDSVPGRLLSIADVVGLAALAWGAAKLLR